MIFEVLFLKSVIITAYNPTIWAPKKIVVKILVLYGDFVGEIPEMFLSFLSCNFFLFW